MLSLWLCPKAITLSGFHCTKIIVIILTVGGNIWRYFWKQFYFGQLTRSSSSVCSMSSSVATVGGKKSPRMIINPGFIDLLHLYVTNMDNQCFGTLWPLFGQKTGWHSTKLDFTYNFVMIQNYFNNLEECSLLNRNFLTFKRSDVLHIFFSWNRHTFFLLLHLTFNLLNDSNWFNIRHFVCFT